MGLSFLARIDGTVPAFRVEIGDFRRHPNGDVDTVPSATYRPVNVNVGDADRSDEQRKRRMWARRPLIDSEGNLPFCEFSIDRLLAERVNRESVPGPEGRINVVVVTRPLGWEGYDRCRLITVSLVNNLMSSNQTLDESCLFQSGLRISSTTGDPWIVPYPSNPPEALSDLAPDDESLISELMYRDWQTFAIGHGCAANWHGEQPKEVSEIWSDTLPIFETASTSADLVDENGVSLKVSMRKLAGLDSSDDGYQELHKLVEAYENWIERLKERLEVRGSVPDRLTATARVLVDRCGVCLSRLKFGLHFLESDGSLAKNARESLKLANHAMLLSQLRASRKIRRSTLVNGRHQWDQSGSGPESRGAPPDQRLLETISNSISPDDLARSVRPRRRR